MKKATLIFLSFLFALVVAGQKSNDSKRIAIQLTETTVVKDTTGNVYPFSIWSPLRVTGRYTFRPETPNDPNTAFFIIRLSDEEYEKRIASLPKPRESSNFQTGAKFSYFKTSDIDGNKLSSKNLKGKILVLNYWFINCPPCRMEIPELNKLTEQYKNDSSVVFVAVALDEKYDLKKFLKTSPFKYTIVDDGRNVAREYNINSYPTNVIIDQEGKIFFHSTGYSMNIAYWINKSIDELKKQAKEKKDVATAPQ